MSQALPANLYFIFTQKTDHNPAGNYCQSTYELGRAMSWADFDGDGKADQAANDQSSGSLALRLSSTGYVLIVLQEFMKP